MMNNAGIEPPAKLQQDVRHFGVDGEDGVAEEEQLVFMMIFSSLQEK